MVVCLNDYVPKYSNSMDEEVSRACEAVNHICLRGDLNEILPSSISLIPPTLQHAVKATGHK